MKTKQIMKEKEPTKLTGKKQRSTTTNVGAGLVPAQTQTQSQQGITLVALVITIIVLLILAGVTIAMLLGPNGIITRAKEAKINWETEAQKEQTDLANLYEEMGEAYGGTETGWNESAGVNEPKLAEGMIPVYYDETAGKWKKADSSNNGSNKWYDYNTKQ